MNNCYCEAKTAARGRSLTARRHALFALLLNAIASTCPDDGTIVCFPSNLLLYVDNVTQLQVMVVSTLAGRDTVCRVCCRLQWISAVIQRVAAMHGAPLFCNCSVS